jgi:hypothetical protein
MKRYGIYGILLIVMLAAACSPAPAETPAPTEALVEEESTPTQELPTRRPLPPTWTPGVAVTITPFPSETLPPRTAIPTPTLPAGCDSFGVDYDSIPEVFDYGTSPTITWDPAEGAAGYRVELYSPEGEAVWVFIAEPDVTTYTFDADLFVVDVDAINLGQVFVYGWEVTPVDAQRVQYCPSIGSEFIPFLPEGVTIPTEEGEE